MISASDQPSATLTDDEDLPDVPAVEFGGTPEARINYLSVSQLKSAAYWTDEGCLRKWFLKKVVGLPEPMRGNLELGKAVHAQLEHLAKTGQDVLGEIARAALRFFPARETIIGIEKSITASNKPITGATVTADGIPLVGFIDRIDLPLGGPIRAVDYKTSKDPEKYAATPEELVTTASGPGIQMVGYAVSLANDLLGLPEDEPIEVEHLYLHTKATKKQRADGEDAKRVVGRLTPAKARAEWAERIDPLAAKLRQVARCSNVLEVEPNWNACGAFGGCAFQTTCLVAEANRNKPQSNTTNGETKMSLGNALAARRAAKQSTPAANQPAPAAEPAVNQPPPAAEPAAKQPDPVVVPPDAPKSDPKLAAEPLTETKTELPEPQASSPAPAEPKKRGPKAGIVAPRDGFALFVDCIPSSGADSLAKYVDARLGEICAAFPGLTDVRLAPKKGKNAEGKDVDHPLAYGAWKGVLAAQCRMNPPKGNVSALGVYGSEFLQVAIEALEPIAAVVVKGVR